MKPIIHLFLGMALALGTVSAEVTIDQDVLGRSLGGWKKRSKKYADYDVSGIHYRTYRPVCTATPDGGVYVSVRIDHVRGLFSSDDHAMLEITIDQHGHIASAKSSIAIQGRSVTSDVIEGVNKAGAPATSSIDKAVQIGTDLVANLSTKLLRTKLIEPGRVAFPSAVRHNFNLLYQAIRVDGKVVPDSAPQPGTVDDKAGEEKALPSPVNLTIEGYKTPATVEVSKPKPTPPRKPGQ